MWGDRTDRLLLAGLLAASLVLFFRYWDYGINDDEGYLLGGVTRILDGQVPYRDFHHTYGPGRFYLVAFLFRLFGENLLVVRALWVALRVLIVGLAFVAGRRFLSRPAAVAAALFFLAAPGPWHKSFFPLFLLANFLFLARLGRGTGRDAAAAGFVAGGTFLFRQDLGIFACLVYALLLLLRRWSDESPRRGAAFFLFALAAVLPFLLYFAFEGALGDAARKVLFAGAGDNRTNALPFPPILLAPSGGGVGLAFAALRALYYLPVPLFVVAGAWGGRGSFAGGRGGGRS